MNSRSGKESYLRTVSAEVKSSRSDDEDGPLFLILKTVSVTGLPKPKVFHSLRTYAIVCIDGNKRWESPVITDDQNPSWIDTQHGVRLSLRPSSELKIEIMHRSSMARDYSLGQVSKTLIELINEDDIQCTLDISGGCLRASLVIDTLNMPTLNELVPDLTSEEVEQAGARLAEAAIEHRAETFVAVSGYLDQGAPVTQTADAVLGAVQSFSGVQALEKTLLLLNGVVQIVDIISEVNPIFQVSWLLLSSVYKLLKKQTQQDENIRKLAVGLCTMLALFKECLDMQQIKGIPIKETAANLVIKGAELIDRIMKSSFMGRAFRSLFDEVEKKLQDFQKQLDALRNDWRDTILVRIHNDQKSIQNAIPSALGQTLFHQACETRMENALSDTGPQQPVTSLNRPISSGSYKIMCVMTGTIAKAPFTTEGAGIVSVKSTGSVSDDEKWIVTSTTNGYTIRNAASNMYAGISHRYGDELVVTAQPIYFIIYPWRLEKTYQVVLATDQSRVWDLSGGLDADGTKLLVYHNFFGGNNQGGQNQAWKFISVL